MTGHPAVSVLPLFGALEFSPFSFPLKAQMESCQVAVGSFSACHFSHGYEFIKFTSLCISNYVQASHKTAK